MMVNKQEARSGKYNMIKNGKNNITIDIINLNLFARLVFSSNKSIKRGNLLMLNKLITSLDMTNYDNDKEKIKYLKIISKGLEGRLNDNIVQREVLIKYIEYHLGGEKLNFDFNLLKELGSGDVKWINNNVSQYLNYNFIYNEAEEFIRIGTKLKMNNIDDIKPVYNSVTDLVSKLQNSIRKNKAQSKAEEYFSLDKDHLDEYMRNLHNYLSDPSTVLSSGIKGLDMMTDGGFANERTYCIFGLPGSGKSNLLIDCAIGIKNNNPCVKTKDPTKRPCVVLLSQENSVRENVVRLFKMTTNSKIPIQGYNIDEVTTILQTQGRMVLNDENPINIIIKYIPNCSIDTSYIYELIDGLNDEGLECIAFIHDYLFRIRSVAKYREPRLELGAVVNEFKVIAILYEIPVILASQLNKDGKQVIDNCRNMNKKNILNALSDTHIAESYSILQNIDWGCVILKETDNEGYIYQGIKCIKMRYGQISLPLFYQPIQSCGLGMVSDTDEIYPLYKTTLLETNLNINNVPNNITTVYQERRSIDEIMNEHKSINKLETDEINKLVNNRRPVFDNKLLSRFDISTDGAIVEKKKEIPIYFINKKLA